MALPDRDPYAATRVPEVGTARGSDPAGALCARAQDHPDSNHQPKGRSRNREDGRASRPHYPRSAVEGEVAAARRAGTQQANRATRPSTPQTPVSVTGSKGLTP